MEKKTYEQLEADLSQSKRMLDSANRTITHALKRLDESEKRNMQLEVQIRQTFEMKGSNESVFQSTLQKVNDLNNSLLEENDKLKNKIRELNGNNSNMGN